MVMKYCENGHSNRDDAKFCGTCGKPIVQKSADFTLDKYPDIKFEVTDYKKYWKYSPVQIVFGFILGFFPGCIMLGIQGELNANSDFMESTNTLSGYKRIAKNGKLGLFDTNHRYVRLRAVFDKIELFDSNHNYYLIQIKEKYGIYSTVFHRAIVPCKYVSISLRSEGVFVCAKEKGNVVYYSCNGKVIR